MKKLGFGMMRLPLIDESDPKSIDIEQSIKLVDTYIAAGYKYFDTAYIYNKGSSEKVIGTILTDRYPREKFILTDKMPCMLIRSREDYDKIFQKQLERTHVEYFDYYFFHALGKKYYKQIEELDGFGWMKQKLEEGKIKHIGFSYHDDAETLDIILSEHPEVELVQLQLSYADWDNPSIQSHKNYEVCVKHNRKVSVMGPLKGGSLVNLPADVETVLKKYEPDREIASWGLNFAAGLDNVFVVLSGMSTIDQVESNIKIMDNASPLTEEEKKVLQDAVELLKSKNAIACTACRYCVDGCPMSINIPSYFGLYNTQHVYGMGDNYIQTYMNIKGGKPSDCIGCGQCESICPQHLPVIDNLKKVTDVFG